MMLELIIGFLAGIVFNNVIYHFVRSRKYRRGLKSKEYSKLSLTQKLADALRHIVYDYGIKGSNDDFLLNILYKEETILQVLHRAHFAELAKDEYDLHFGMAFYIPVSKLSALQNKKLKDILTQEARSSKEGENPIEYHVIDLGTGIKFGAYLISRVLKEVFEYNIESNMFDLKLYSQGPLSYFPRKDGFSIEN